MLSLSPELLFNISKEKKTEPFNITTHNIYELLSNMNNISLTNELFNLKMK